MNKPPGKNKRNKKIKGLTGVLRLSVLNEVSFVSHGTDLGREAPIDLFKQMGTHDINGVIYPEVVKKLKTLAQGPGRLR